MTRKRKEGDSLLKLVEREARAVLKTDGITVAEKLKAIELIAKVAMIRHKIQDGGGSDGAFFAGR